MDAISYILKRLTTSPKPINAAPWKRLDPVNIGMMDAVRMGGMINIVLGGISMVNVADLMISSLDMITAKSLSGIPRFVVDELQNAKIANTQEKNDLTGKQGRKIGSLKKNKGVVISGTNGVISAGMMEAQTGGTFETKASIPVSVVDYLTVDKGAAYTEFKAVGTDGKEIEALYVVNESGVAETTLEQATAVAAGKFTYTPTTKKLAFHTDITDGTRIVVYYTRNVAGDVMENLADKYSEKLRLYIDGTAEDFCGNVYHIQFYMPRADFSGNFDIDLGGDQTVHAFEAESLPEKCGSDGLLWSYVVFGVNAPDAA